METDENGQKIDYKYGGEDKDGDFNTEKGLAQMRSKAGIAMEYLEKEEQDN